MAGFGKKKRLSAAQRIAQNNIKNNVHVYMVQAVFLLAARDTFGLGHDRLMKFYSKAKMYFEACSTGEVTLDDLLVTLQNEVGIAIGPHGIKDIRGQTPPMNLNGVVMFNEDDATDDSRDYTEDKPVVLSKTLRDKISMDTQRRKL